MPASASTRRRASTRCGSRAPLARHDFRPQAAGSATARVSEAVPYGKALIMLLILLIILIVLALGGGFGYGGGRYRGGGIGLGGILIVILLVLLLTGRM